MQNGNYHKRSLARFIFNHFSKKYGKGHFSHGRIMHKIDFIEQEVSFSGLKLRFCMFTQDDAVTYLTVFDDSQKGERSQGKILLLTSALTYEETVVKGEVQHVYNDAQPTEKFVTEVHALFKDYSDLQSLWPRKTSEFLMVA